jgi:sec-independent protein translocase protein TatC
MSDPAASMDEESVAKSSTGVVRDRGPDAMASAASGGTPVEIEKPAPPKKKPAPPPKKETTEEPEDDVEMSFMEHLVELRKYLIRSVWGFIPGIIIAWIYREEILLFLAYPFLHAYQELHLGQAQLHFANPADLLVQYMLIALVCGGLFGSPWAFAQLWAFISPGLYRREKLMAIPFVVMSTIFFVGGAFFGYWFVLPPAFTALLSFAGDLNDLGLGTAGTLRLEPTIMIDQYIEVALRLLIALGVTFEEPILIGFISYIGLVNWRQLLDFSRWWVVIASVVAAVLTPTPDIATMMLVMVPLVLLYYLGILFAYLFGPKVPTAAEIAAQKAREEQDD